MINEITKVNNYFKELIGISYDKMIEYKVINSKIELYVDNNELYMKYENGLHDCFTDSRQLKFIDIMDDNKSIILVTQSNYIFIFTNCIYTNDILKLIIKNKLK